MTHIPPEHATPPNNAEAITDKAKKLTSKIFTRSIDIIDTEYGNEYSKKNPRLLASVIDLQSKIYIHFLNSN